MTISSEHIDITAQLQHQEITGYTGEVVYLFAFDIAYDMIRQPVRELLGQSVATFAFDVSRRSPRHLLFHRSQMIRLPPEERIGPHGALRVETTIKLFAVGAISIAIHVPFAVTSLGQLIDYHQLEFNNVSLHQEAVRLARQVQQELADFYLKPVRDLIDDEAYTVFCIHSPFATVDQTILSTEAWWPSHQREIACLLTEEYDANQLSELEEQESTERYLTYYKNDLVVIDWDAALVIDDPKNFAQTLHVMELANLQLAELEAYDRLLDQGLERAYRDLQANSLRSSTTKLREIRELRVDLARCSDELSNITKFLGDWHLARIYQQVSTRFHLADWHRIVNEKLTTLDNLYQMLQHAQSNSMMLILEVLIVVMFAVDLLMIFLK